MIPNFQMIAIAAAVFVVVSGGLYVKGRYDGSSACDLRHETALREETEKLRKSDDKIKRSAPNDVDKLAAINFLLSNVRQ